MFESEEITRAIISPSILSCDYMNMERDFTMCKEMGAKWLHVDVMDGISGLTFFRAFAVSPRTLYEYDGIRTRTSGLRAVEVNPNSVLCTSLTNSITLFRRVQQNFSKKFSATPVGTAEKGYFSVSFSLFACRAYRPLNIARLKRTMFRTIK